MALDKSKLVRSEDSAKALPFIVVAYWLPLTAFRFMQPQKANSPIWFTVEGRVTDFNVEFLINALSETATTISPDGLFVGITRFSIVVSFRPETLQVPLLWLINFIGEVVVENSS